MGLHSLTYKQCIPISIVEAWDFFSFPASLARVTPPEMNRFCSKTARNRGLMRTGIISMISVKFPVVLR